MAGIKEEKKIYLVGIYCRLSKDDGTDNESASIATQKSILTDYVKKQGWHIAKTYVDDGYSGTNFQRPSFQNMIKDIESGLINCVITKDLSRLGRNRKCNQCTDTFRTTSASTRLQQHQSSMACRFHVYHLKGIVSYFLEPC